MTRAALYLRQSLDRDNRQEGIARQRERCRQLAAARDWDVVAEYVDNDVSASKPRGAGTAWSSLLADAEAGAIDVVVAVDQDRLMRGLRDLVALIDLGVKIATVDGEIDLTSADGEFRATIAAGLARFEVARKSERQRRSNQQGRDLGVPPGGRRAFGYSRLSSHAKSEGGTRVGSDGGTYPNYGHEPVEPEASAVRRGYDLLLAGASLRSIARDWNAAGLTTTTGHEWEPYAVRGVLSNPRYAAKVAPPRLPTQATAKHNLGLEDLADGTWEPLVPLQTWLAARDVLADPARRATTGPAPRWLLSGIAKCGVCGAPMKGGATNDKVKVYRCSRAHHLSRKADDADLFVAATVVTLLSDRKTVARLAARQRPDRAVLEAQLREAQQGEANTLSLVSRGLTSMVKAEAALRDVRTRIADLEAAMTDAGAADLLGPVAGADDVRAAWNALDIERQRAIVKLLIAIEMLSPGKGSRPPRDDAGRMAYTARATIITPR